MARRKKPLSLEDRNLWKKVTQTIDPLARTTKIHLPGVTQKKSTTSTVLAESHKAAIHITKPLPTGHMNGVHHSASPLHNHSVLPTYNSIDYKTRRKITRGRMPIDARIDLHGMNQNRAISMLRDFIYQAQAEDYRLVLVITGKGEAGTGILRRSVPQWLSGGDLAAMVSGFQEAHISHGGGGALYVRLKRRKQF